MTERVLSLKKAVSYLRMYKGRIFVIKVGGEVIGEPKLLDGFAEQIGMFHQLSIQTVIVHGGGPQATELARQLGIPVEIVGGRRVTSPETLEVAKMIFNGKLNTDVLAALRKHKVPGVGLSGVDGGLINAVRRPATRVVDEENGAIREVDFGLVGDVVSVDPAVIHHLLNGSFVPVVSALAGGSQGEVYNVNADTIAAQLACALKAEKLIVLTDVDGVLADADDPASLISALDYRRLEEMLSSVKGGMKAKLEACRLALKGGVARTHIISGMRPDSLLIEIFTNEGCGTLIEAATPRLDEASK